MAQQELVASQALGLDLAEEVAREQQLAVPQRGAVVAWLGLAPHGLVAPI